MVQEVVGGGNNTLLIPSEGVSLMCLSWCPSEKLAQAVQGLNNTKLISSHRKKIIAR